MEIDMKNALSIRVMESFEESINDIMRGMSSLEDNFEHEEFLDLNARKDVLDAGYNLEIAVYRSIVYKLDIQSIMQPKLQKLNSVINALAMKTNHEFFKNFNLKIVGLISVYIVSNM